MTSVSNSICCAFIKDKYEIIFVPHWFVIFTAHFNNMRTLKSKAQPTNAFFATVNQMLGASSQPPTTAERTVIKSLYTVQTMKQCSAVVVSWEKPPNIWLTATKKAFVGRLLNFRVPMLLKSAVIEIVLQNHRLENTVIPQIQSPATK